MRPDLEPWVMCAVGNCTEVATHERWDQRRGIWCPCCKPHCTWPAMGNPERSRGLRQVEAAA